MVFYGLLSACLSWGFEYRFFFIIIIQEFRWGVSNIGSTSHTSQLSGSVFKRLKGKLFNIGAGYKQFRIMNFYDISLYVVLDVEPV